jgi:predicted glycosyltransferase
MIWFDLVTPKSVLFFIPIIKEIENRGRKVLITAREGDGYSEVVELLRLYKMDFVNRGEFGGACLKDKLRASIERQKALMEFVTLYDIDRLVCLCSVDANRVAFGLGVPVINFYDIPLSDHTSNFKKALPQARLTLPLSSKVFKPFVVPNDIFLRFSLDEEQVFDYDFIDPLIWLDNFKPDFKEVENILRSYSLDLNKPMIVIREEEYKSSYVDKKYPILYEALEQIQKETNSNIIIIPRYESEYLKQEFHFATVLEEKVIIQHLLAFADLFIGGGGTLNTEACYFNTPTISTRSFICHYDKYQIDNGLMVWVNTKEELMNSVNTLLRAKKSEEKNVFNSMNLNIPKMVDNILS